MKDYKRFTKPAKNGYMGYYIDCENAVDKARPTVVIWTAQRWLLINLANLKIKWKNKK